VFPLLIIIPPLQHTPLSQSYRPWFIIIIIIIIIVVVVVAVQPFVGSWPLFQFLEPIHSR
jgi:hypothetical protein